MTEIVSVPSEQEDCLEQHMFPYGMVVMMTEMTTKVMTEMMTEMMTGAMMEMMTKMTVMKRTGQ